MKLAHHSARSVSACSAVASAGLLVAASSGGTALADELHYTITTVVKQGTVIEGFGTVGVPSDVSVNNNGFWGVTVPLSNPSGGAILTPAGVHMAVGDELEPDVVVSSLTSALKGLNNNGDFAHRPSFAGDAHSGLVFNHDVLILRDQISQAPEFSPDTPYIGFFRARVNDHNEIFLVATVNDSELPGNVHRALVWVDYDPDTGDFTESVLAKRYDQLPGQPEGVVADEFGTGAERFDINNNGDAIFTVGFTGGDPATNAAIYVNHTLVAQKGDAGPFQDATYNIGTSSFTRVSINNHGDYIFLAPLTGDSATNQAILRNSIANPGDDELFIRKGDPVPGMPDRTITSLGTGAQPLITDDGDIVWYAQWDGDSATNHGLFVNDQLIMQRGVTQTEEGDLITTVAGTTGTSNGITTSFDVNENGRYILVRVMLNNSTSERAALLVTFCKGKADINCDGVVDGADLGILLANWGPCDDCDDCPADLNGDCKVDGADLGILLANWG